MERAAQIEPAVVFPDHVYTQIAEARHLPGTIAIEPSLMLAMLDGVCREIARNGIRKIVLVNAHGGNSGLLSLFMMQQLHEPRDYVVYVVNPGRDIFTGAVSLPWDLSAEGHAGPSETSMIMALRPDLVDATRIPPPPEGAARGELDALKRAGVETGMDWYADYPTHYQGDARVASAEAGEHLLAHLGGFVAKSIAAIKADDRTARLQRDYSAAAGELGQ